MRDDFALLSYDKISHIAVLGVAQKYIVKKRFRKIQHQKAVISCSIAVSRVIKDLHGCKHVLVFQIDILQIFLIIHLLIVIGRYPRKLKPVFYTRFIHQGFFKSA